ncbi:MAG TPA: ATP-binding protein, partial [Enhygromyxa sp.]|nr:ATP-binding protein [Enhygromyxa sp.]
GTPALAIQRRAGVRSVQSTPLFGRGGAVIGMLSTHRRTPGEPSEHQLQLLDLVARQAADIIERAAVEESLRRSESRLRALVQASSEVLYRMSPDWSEMRYLDGGGFLAKTEEPTAGWLSRYIHLDDRVQVLAAIQEAIRSKSVFALEHRVTRADGSLGWTSSRAVPLLDEHGEIIEWFGAANDITRRKLAELANERAHAELLDANQRKDEYIAMLGHELRNPAAAIRHATELLAQVESDDPNVLRTRAVLERQSSHLARLLDGLLEVSRLVRGKIELELQTLDLCEVMRVELSDRAMQLGGLRLTTKLPSEPLWVRGDPVRLAQVFDNLLGNAIKFTATPGSICVSLDRDESWARVRIRDTGIGIAPEMLDRVFEVFRQAKQKADRSLGGLGLGLALAKNLIELHHGTIAAHSEGPGTGTEIEVRLPLSHARVEPPPEQSFEPPPRVRVLLVEDNADAAEMLQALLTRAGHEVTVVSSGRSALERLQTEQTDVVLCDLGLPGLSGLELARTIRDDPQLHGLPLVAITGYGQPDDERRSADAGFHAHLTKPVDFETVERAIGEVLRRRGA